MEKAVLGDTPYGTESVSAVGTATEVKPVEDVVNHPNHYAPNGRDSFMHMKDQMGKAAFDGFLQGNIIKYVQRYALKGKPTEDLCKAAFYLLHLAFETAGDEKEALGVGRRLTETLAHAAEHYGLEVK